EVNSGDAGGDCNVEASVRAKSDAICTWEGTLGSERRERFLTRPFSKERSASRVGNVNGSVDCDSKIVELVSGRCVVAIYKKTVFQIVANDSVSSLLLRLIEKTVRAHRVQLLVRSVDKQAEHTIQIVFPFREILQLTFSIGAHDFLLRDAAN